MHQNSSKIFQLNLPSIGSWLSFIAILLLLKYIGLGGLVNGFFILIGLIIITPTIAFFGFSWWIKRNQVRDQCPVCSQEFVGFNGTEIQCPSCGEPLKIEHKHFQRFTPPGTIDVQAVEVSSQQLKD